MGGREPQLSTEQALAPRWQGQPGRLEAWYATWTDPVSGQGGWLHHEIVAPTDGAEAHVLGWAALFLSDREPVVERFGPDAVLPGGWPLSAGATFRPPVMSGRAGRLSWHLEWDEADTQAPLFTFPRWAWERETLPAAQIVAVPRASFSGSLELDGAALSLSPVTVGNVAHIYGHGNAQRWGWLHADLGGGDVLEVVSAVSGRPGLDHLPPLAFVQLRAGGRDWPRDPLASAPLMRTELGLPDWRVRGTVGRWRLRVEVHIPPGRAATVAYADPDGAPALCTNSELADASVILEHRRSRWETAATWELLGTAHAEVGLRSFPD